MWAYYETKINRDYYTIYLMQESLNFNVRHGSTETGPTIFIFIKDWHFCIIFFDQSSSDAFYPVQSLTLSIQVKKVLKCLRYLNINKVSFLLGKQNDVVTLKWFSKNCQVFQNKTKADNFTTIIIFFILCLKYMAV